MDESDGVVELGAGCPEVEISLKARRLRRSTVKNSQPPCDINPFAPTRDCFIIV